MPGWLWDTVFQYPLADGDTRTQYSDGSTFVGPLKDGMRHGKGAYFFQDGSRWVARPLPFRTCGWSSFWCYACFLPLVWYARRVYRAATVC